MGTVHHTQHPDTPLDKLKTELQSIQQTRTLAIWHDHSTLQTGYILFAVWVVYAKTGKKTGKKVQAFNRRTRDISIHDRYSMIDIHLAAHPPLTN